MRAPKHLSPKPKARPTRPERPQALRTQAPARQPNPRRPDPNARKPQSLKEDAASQKPIKQPTAASRSTGRKRGAGWLEREAAAPAGLNHQTNPSECLIVHNLVISDNQLHRNRTLNEGIVFFVFSFPGELLKYSLTR